MRDANAVGRLQLKSKLLIGVAGLAAAASSAAAAAEATTAAPPPAATTSPPATMKWLPYADIGGGIGSGFAQGKVDLFAPVWQDMDSLLFARLGIGTQTHNDEVMNIGLGYRTKISPDWILGIFGGVDKTHTDLGQNFSQYSLGVEAMSTDWDVRVNGYRSRSHSHPLSDTFELYIHDTQIAVLQAQQAALSGFDGEVGYRVFHTDNTDVRVFAGGFVFQNDHHERTAGLGQDFDFKYPTLSGPRGRVEVNIFDLDVIGNQSRVSFDGEVSHDKQRGTTGFAGATLRIPLGMAWGQGGQALDDLDRRMADPVRRHDDVLTQWQFNKPEPVIIYNGTITSEPTNTLYYVSDTTAGSGSYDDPTTINDAAGRDAVNQFIVVTDFGGNVGASNAAVHGGETIVAGGQTFNVRGVDSQQVFVHDFAPNSGTPTIVPIHPGDNLLNVEAGGVTIQGLNFAGDFGSAIYGHNIDQLDVFDVHIDGSDGGQYGVKIKQDVTGDVNVHVSNSTLENLGQDGIYLQSNLDGAGTSNAKLEITDSAITGSGNADAIMVGTVSGSAVLNQTLIIDPTTLSGGNYAILVGGTANGATLNQNISLTDVTIDNVTNSGIYIYAYGLNGGHVVQHITMDNVTVTGAFSGGGEGEAVSVAAVSEGSYAYGNLITIAAGSVAGGTVGQSFDLSHVHATGAYYDEILLAAYAGDGGFTHQFGTMNDVVANDSIYGDGVHVMAYGIGSSRIIQEANIEHLSASGNYDYGFEVSAVAGQLEEGLGVAAADGDGPTALVAQYVQLNHATLTNNFGGMEVAGRTGGYASLLQDVAVTNSNLSNNFFGFDASLVVSGGASGQQILTLTGDTIAHNYGDGADFLAEGLFEGFAAQSIYIDASNLSFNGDDGADIFGLALFGGDVEQNIGVYNSFLIYNGGNGLELGSDAYGYDVGFESLYYSHVTQNFIMGGTVVSRNDEDGVRIGNRAAYGGQLDQFVYIYDSKMNGNARDGFHETTIADAVGYYGYALGTAAYSDVYVVDSFADHNGRIGIYVGSDAHSTYSPYYLFGATYLIQHVLVQGTEANQNGIGGLAESANAEGLFTLNIQYVTLDSSHFDSNELFGAGFQATQYFGPGSFGAAIQDVTIFDSDFSHNGRYGLAGIADASGFQGRAEQNFVISGSHFNDNGTDGIYLYRHAHDGAYYSYTYGEYTYGYPCTGAQNLAGGCAFVRQTVQIVDSEATYNGHDGIYVKSVADNYGAIYSRSGRPYDTPTLVLVGTDVSHNGYDGLGMYNNVGAGSYLYQYALAINSHFDNNGFDGIRLTNIVHDGGFVGQYRTYTYTYDGDTYTYTYLYPGSKLTLYNSTASNNGANGIELSNNVSGNSTLYQYVQFINSHADNNLRFGIVSDSYAFGGSELLQGIGLYTYVPEGSETFAAVTTTVDHNGYGGIQIFGYGYKSHVGSALYLNNVDVSYNGFSRKYPGSGVYMGLNSRGADVAVQSFISDNSQFTHNAGVGVDLLNVGVYDGFNLQQVVSYHNHFDDNGRFGFGAVMRNDHVDTGIQFLISFDDHFSGNATGGLIQYASFNYSTGGQLSRVTGGTFQNNGFGPLPDIGILYGNGILVGMNANNSYTAGFQYIVGNTIDGAGINGIDVEISATGGALVYDTTVIVQNTIYRSGGDGVRVGLTAGGYSGEGYGISGSTIAAGYYEGGVYVNNNLIGHVGYGEYGGSGIDIALAAAQFGTIGAYGPDGYGGYFFPIQVDGNTVFDVYGNGILVSTANIGGVVLTKTEIGHYASNAVTHVGGVGIGVVSFTSYGFGVAETDIENNVVSEAAQAGIVAANVNFGGTAFRYTDINSNSVYGYSYTGIVVADINSGGIVTDQVGIGGNDIHGTYLGIGVFDSGAVQTSHIADNKIYGDDTTYGIAGYAYGAATQLIYTYVPGNDQYGIPAGNQYYFYYELPGTQFVF